MVLVDPEQLCQCSLNRPTAYQPQIDDKDNFQYIMDQVFTSFTRDNTDDAILISDEEEGKIDTYTDEEEMARMTLPTEQPMDDTCTYNMYEEDKLPTFDLGFTLFNRDEEGSSDEGGTGTCSFK